MHEIDMVESWLSNVALSHSNAKTTDRLYRRGLSYFLKFTGLTAKEICTDYARLPEREFKRKYGQILQAWAGNMRTQGLMQGTIGSYMIPVKSFFKYSDLPLGFVPTIRRIVSFHNRDITKEEIIQFLGVSSPRERAFYAVMAQSGLRPSTICALKMKHLEPDYSENRVPLKITVPEDLTKGEYHGYITFIAEDAIRYLKAYLNTRPKLAKDSFVFANQGTEDPMIYNTVSSLFGRAARNLRTKGVMDYEQKQTGKPAEIRLYTLRKWFRKMAIQAGFENVDYWMGHTGPGVDAAYRPKDDEFYRKIYAEKAMPFLRLDAGTPTENEKIVADLIRENTQLKAEIAQVQGGSYILGKALIILGESANIEPEIKAKLQEILNQYKQCQPRQTTTES